MEVYDLISFKSNKIEEEIKYKFPNLLDSYPIGTYTEDIESYPILSNYHYLSPKLIEFFGDIETQYDSYALILFHKLACSKLILHTIESDNLIRLPISIQKLFYQWCERIIDDFTSQPDDYYSHKNDQFLKDMAVCCLRLLPVGAWAVEVSGIERRFIFTGGFKQFYQSLLFLIFKMKGFKPFYQIHTVLRYVQGFNPEGREKCYLRIAELLKRNTEIKGMFALSWLYDPQLESVSPRLAYLRLLPEKYGAKVFHIGTRQVDIYNALAKSPTRRKLYKEGKYMPTAYIKIWPRKELIDWADKRLESSSLA